MRYYILQQNKRIDDTLTKPIVSRYHYKESKQMATEQDLRYFPKEEIENLIRDKRKHMQAAANSLEFIIAAKLRDEIALLREKL